MKYYECHVTMTGDPDVIRPHVEKLKWKFSVIDGDILLGSGLKCYATRLFNVKLTSETVLAILMSTAKILSNSGCNVVRRKVEQVIFDDRSSKMQCIGACVECHLDDINQK